MYFKSAENVFKHSRIHKSVSFSGSLNALFFFVSILKKKCRFRYIICIRWFDEYEIKKKMYSQFARLGLSH